MFRTAIRSSSALLMAFVFASAANGAFYDPKKTPEKPNQFDRAIIASLRLTFDGNGVCSATAISSDGYVLTNLHCLKKCFELASPQGAPQFIDEFKTGDYDIWRARDQSPARVVCKTYRSSSNWSFQYSDPELVWMGRGKSSFDDLKVLDLPSDLYALMLENNDDYAILKYKTSSKSIPCLPISKTPAQAGDRVWSLGYPARTLRKDGLNSDGVMRFSSIGHVRATIQDDPYLRKNVSDEASWSRLKEYYDRDSLLLSDLDAMPGSSGSMILNSDGELVAVLYGKVQDSYTEYVDSTTTSIRIKTIVDEVTQGLGEEKAREIFGCAR